MLIRVLGVVFSIILSSCGGGSADTPGSLPDNQSAVDIPSGNEGASDITPNDESSSDDPSGPLTPLLITDDTPIDVDASVTPVAQISKQSTLYYSFRVNLGKSYRITLKSLSGNADFTLLGDSLLSDISVVETSQSDNAVESVTYNAIDNRTMYIEVSALDDTASFKLYVNTENIISTRAKFFVTSERHNGNLSGDATIPGSNAIEKADYICSISVDRPDNHEYKALLLDGLYRDAPTKKDWVLQPNTTYYRNDGVIPIGTTNGDALFTLTDQPGQESELEHSIDNCASCGLLQDRVWTGIADTGDLFSFFFTNCGGWSSTAAATGGAFGISTSTSSAALHTSVDDCNSEHAFYCVQQP